MEHFPERFHKQDVRDLELLSNLYQSSNFGVIYTKVSNLTTEGVPHILERINRIAMTFINERHGAMGLALTMTITNTARSHIDRIQTTGSHRYAIIIHLQSFHEVRLKI